MASLGSQSHERKPTILVLDPLLWVSILGDNKEVGVLAIQEWVSWIHEEFQLDQFHLLCVTPINLGSCAQNEAK
jgi:hypothetical protein